MRDVSGTPHAVHALILAGGSGTRLWPLSTDATARSPFSPWRARESLLRETFRRAARVAGAGERLVSATAVARGAGPQASFPRSPSRASFSSRCGGTRRRRSPSAALAIEAEAPGAVLVVLPSDQAVRDEEAFVAALRTAVEAARTHDAFVTLGIPPTRPETGLRLHGDVERGDRRGIFYRKGKGEPRPCAWCASWKSRRSTRARGVS